jgi:hypothetical protein
MQPLPSQVLSPLRDALSIHRTQEFRLRALGHARYELALLKSNAGIYSESVDTRFHGLGMEQVDATCPEQADAFLDRIGESGLKALNKRQRVAAAIAYAEMTIEWLDWELSDGR